MSVYLISETYLKQHSTIEDSVDFELLKPAILEAQEIHIRDVIGSGIYNQIISEVTSGTFTGLNQSLLNNYIKPALVKWVLVEALPEIAYRIVNKGLMTKNADNAQPISESQILARVDRYKNKAEYYSERITKYIKANITDFPLYNNPGSGVDVIRPRHQNYDCGIYTGETGTGTRSFEERYQGNNGC